MRMTREQLRRFIFWPSVAMVVVLSGLYGASLLWEADEVEVAVHEQKPQAKQTEPDRQIASEGTGSAPETPGVEVTAAPEVKVETAEPEKSEHEKSGPVEQSIASTEQAESSKEQAEPSKAPPVTKDQSLKKLAKLATEKAVTSPVSTTAMPAGVQASSGPLCAAVEYPGEAPDLIHSVKAEQWKPLMDDFHWAKARLVSWVMKRHGLSHEVGAQLVKQVKNLRIQRPPASDEPEMSWRGILAFSRDADGSPILRVGYGFFTLFKKDRTRARFELLRSIAQMWGPCELQKSGVTQITWDPFLKCLGLPDAGTCTPGSYSEGGWAVSAAFASLLAAPGCTVPVFASQEGASCLLHLKSMWMEAKQ